MPFGSKYYPHNISTFKKATYKWLYFRIEISTEKFKLLSRTILKRKKLQSSLFFPNLKVGCKFCLKTVKQPKLLILQAHKQFRQRPRSANKQKGLIQPKLESDKANIIFFYLQRCIREVGEERNTVKSMREAMWGPVGYCSSSTCSIENDESERGMIKH